MTIIRVKGFKIFKDRGGYLRCYHRRTGVAIDLRKTPIGTAGFIAECARIAALDQKVFDWLHPIADTLLKRFDRPLVVRIRDKAAASKGRRFGNYAKAVLSIIFAWGRERGFIADNPASGIKDIRRPRGAVEPAMVRSGAPRCP